jgi:beta-phosphoglucomutase-like phosphatase (HAD superfamily)
MNCGSIQDRHVMEQTDGQHRSTQRTIWGLKGVLLDVDGTLIDSNDAHTSAWLEALREHGCTVPFERVRRMIGMGGDKLLPAAVGIDADSQLGKAISASRQRIFLGRHLPTLRPFPCARALLERLRGDDFRNRSCVLRTGSRPKRENSSVANTVIAA